MHTNIRSYVVRCVLCVVCVLFSIPVFAVEWNFTVLPNASIRYRADSRQLPQSYIDRFAGISSPVYRLQASQTPSRSGYWSMMILHTGEFGGGRYGMERVPDNTTGGTYQTNKLNVGFVDTAITYHHAVKAWPVEALVNLSVMRGFYKRKEFIIQGTDLGPTRFDDVNELSAEGLGVGLSGRHGDKFYLRWQTDLNYYIQLADAKTDASFGQVFRSEAGLGTRLWHGLSLEVGGLSQYWYIPGPARRLVAPRLGNLAAIISWQRQEVWTNGAFLRVQYSFE